MLWNGQSRGAVDQVVLLGNIFAILQVA